MLPCCQMACSLDPLPSPRPPVQQLATWVALFADGRLKVFQGRPAEGRPTKKFWPFLKKINFLCKLFWFFSFFFVQTLSIYHSRSNHMCLLSIPKAVPENALTRPRSDRTLNGQSHGRRTVQCASECQWWPCPTHPLLLIK